MADGGTPGKRPQGALPKGWPRPTASLERRIERKTGLSGKRQWALVGLALAGLGVGYALGVLTAPSVAPPPQKTASAQKAEVPPPAAATPQSTPKPATTPTATPDGTAPDPIANKLRAIMPQITDGGAPAGPTGKPLAYEEPLPHDVGVDKLRQQPRPADQSTAVAAPTETANAPADTAATPPDKLPPWRRYALAVAPIGDQPVVAIVMDDLGVDRHRTEKVEELPGPLTLSYMTYAREVQKQVDRGRSYGHEIMMHVPMEPTSTAVDPGPHVLLTAMPADEIKTTLDWDLSRFHGYTGINNHMGSKFTSDREALNVVMQTVKQRGLLFLDSLTSAKSHGAELAHADGVPYAVRNVFIDDSEDPAAIRRQLATTARIAKETGSAIAIGHPHDNTIAELRTWIEGLKKQGIRLVPLSALIKKRFPETPATAKQTAPKSPADNHPGQGAAPAPVAPAKAMTAPANGAS